MTLLVLNIKLEGLFENKGKEEKQNQKLTGLNLY